MKGITPVIAVILLLLITISVVGSSMLFFQRTAQTATQAGDTELQQLTKSQGIPRLEGSSGNKVYLRSVGGTPLENPTFFVANQKVDATGPASLAPGQMGIYILDENQLESLPDTAEVKVTTGGYSDSIIAMLREIFEKIFTSAATVTGLVTGEGDGILFKSTTGADLAAISDSGLMGIGTASPDVKLHLEESVSCDLYFRMKNTAGAVTNNFRIQVPSTASGNSKTTFFSGGTAALTLEDNTGNVGIGTSAPMTKLDIYTASTNPDRASGGMLTVRSSDAQAADKGGSMVFGGNRDDGAVQARNFGGIVGYKENSITTNQAGYLAFSTNSNAAMVEAMRISSAGNVGIGTTSPGRKLHIDATGSTYVRVGGTSTASQANQLELLSGSGKYSFMLGTQNNVNNGFEITPSTAAGGTTFSNPALVVLSGGNVGIGTQSPGQKLEVAGNISITRTAASAGNNTWSFIYDSANVCVSKRGWNGTHVYDGPC